MKRSIGWSLVICVLLGAVLWLTYPVAGQVWVPAQIERATVNGNPVPRERFGELLADLRRGNDSKCGSEAELWLKNGNHLMLTMDPILAKKYEKGCG